MLPISVQLKLDDLTKSNAEMILSLRELREVLRVEREEYMKELAELRESLQEMRFHAARLGEHVQVTIAEPTADLKIPPMPKSLKALGHKDPRDKAEVTE